MNFILAVTYFNGTGRVAHPKLAETILTLSFSVGVPHPFGFAC
jgi:hypothetical protein